MDSKHKPAPQCRVSSVVLGFILSLCLVSPACASTSQHEVFSTFANTDSLNVIGLDQLKATLASPGAAALLIKALPPPADGQYAKDEYCIIHLLRWSDSSTTGKPKVDADNWYLYRYTERGWSQEAFTSDKRLFGAQRVRFLFVHFNVQNTVYAPDYDFTIAKKTPANVAHLYALISSFAGNATPDKSVSKARKPEERKDTNWGGGEINLKYVPSDISIKSTFRTQSSETDQKLAADIAYDNEGLYHWDVGFAVPVRKISEIKLDSTSGVATPAQVNSQNVFAVIDGYLKPVDVKGDGFNLIPHPLVGVAFAKQPLHKILVGGAWGPHAAELYMGVLFVKQPELSGSTSCSNPVGSSVTSKSHFCAQFTIGINLSVSSIVNKLGARK